MNKQTSKNDICRGEAYVGDVTPARRVVGVGAADEHLLIVDAR